MEDMGRNGFKQLCWQCKKACNLNLCIWVKTLKKLPKGAKLDKQGNITYCPNFEKDNGIYTREEYIKSLGLTEKEYQKIYYAVLELLNKNIKASINECILFINKTGGTYKDYAVIKRGLNRGNLEYIPLEYAYRQLKSGNYQNMASFVYACNKEYKIKTIDITKLEKKVTLHDRIENYCKQLGITRELYVKIKMVINRYNKKDVKLDFEEFAIFVKNHKCELWQYVSIKVALIKNNLEHIAVDSVFNQLHKNSIRCMADYIKAYKKGLIKV